jgi:hypothetical protein
MIQQSLSHDRWRQIKFAKDHSTVQHSIAHHSRTEQSKQGLFVLLPCYSLNRLIGSLQSHRVQDITGTLTGLLSDTQFSLSLSYEQTHTQTDTYMGFVTIFNSLFGDLKASHPKPYYITKQVFCYMCPWRWDETWQDKRGKEDAIMSPQEHWTAQFKQKDKERNNILSGCCA